MPKRKGVDVPVDPSQSKKTRSDQSGSAVNDSNQQSVSDQSVPAPKAPDYLSSLGLSLADLMEMANESSDVNDRPTEDGLGASTRTILAQGVAWKRFEEYFDGRKERGTLHLIPGSPKSASDLLAIDAPAIDAPTFIAFIEWTAARCTTPRIKDVMASSTAERIFNELCGFIKSRKNVNVSRKVRRTVKAAITGSIVDKGLLHRESKPKFITDQNGYRSLALSALDPRFLVKHIRSRFQLLLWMAITAQTALRRGSMLPPATVEVDRALNYEHITVHLLGDGVITLTLTPPHSKTAEGQDAVYTLVQTPEFYRCPVFLFLLLAQLDGLLPYPIEELCRRAALPEDQAEQLDFQVKQEDQATMVFRATSKDSVNDIPLIDHSLSEQLARISSIAGFSTNITAHAFRRMVAIFMRVRGSSYAEIQLKLAHRLQGTVTRIYMNLVCPADITAAVWGGQDRTLECLNFHPQILREDRSAPIALDSKTRAEIFANDDVCSIADALDAMREKALLKYGPDIASYPPDVKEELDNKWSEYRRLYASVYREKLAAYLATYHEEAGVASTSQVHSDADLAILDTIPEDGATYAYDIPAVEVFLSSVNIENGAQVLEAMQSIQAVGQQSTSEDEDLDDTDPSPAKDGEADALEMHSDPTASDMVLSNIDRVKNQLMGQGHDIPAVIQACSLLNSNSRTVFKSRPQHDWSDSMCPCCGQSLWAAASVMPSLTENGTFASRTINLFTTHVARCYAEQALADIEERLLERYPARLPTMPVVLRRREPRKRQYSDEDGTQNIHEMYCWLLKRAFDGDGAEQACSACAFKSASFSLLRAHMLVNHNWWIPTTTSTWPKTPAGQAYLRGEWTAISAKFPLPRWHWPDRSYHADPRELELFCEKYFKQRILEPAKTIHRFGIRKDITVNPGSLEKDQNNCDPDTRYHFIQQRAGPVEQEGLCFFAVWNPALSWTERMEPLDRGHSAYALRNRTTLHSVLAGLDLLFEQIEKESSGVDVVQEKKDAVKEKARLKNAKAKARRQSKDAHLGSSSESDVESDEPESANGNGPSTSASSTSCAKRREPTSFTDVPMDPVLKEMDGNTDPPAPGKRKRNKRLTIPKSRTQKVGALQKPLMFKGRPSDLDYLVQDRQLACPDSVCRSIGHRSDSQVSFVNHLVSVHYFTLFDVGNQPKTLANMGFSDETELREYRGLAPLSDGDQNEQDAAGDGQGRAT